MHKNTTKCNKTLSKWCKNKHGASKIIDTFETYQIPSVPEERVKRNCSALSGQIPVEQKPVEEKTVERKMALSF
jgi:hypothetical protein